MCRPPGWWGVPTATADDGTELRYAVAGDGAGEGAPVALVNDVGFGPWAWGWQHDALAGPRRVVAFDHRGTGGSGTAGPRDVARLAADCDAVLGAAGARGAHLVGFGLGGAVALRHARERRVRSLTLVGTAPGAAVDADALDGCYPGADATAEAGAVRETLPALFSAGFREAHPELLDRVVDWRLAEDAGPDARRAQADAWLDAELGPLYEVTTPALVLRGTDDPVVGREPVESLAADLPRGRFEAVAGRRLAHAESARAVNDALLDFFAGVEADD
jgi:pimeloyl-ACP methyl ester carboxylesterase